MLWEILTVVLGLALLIAGGDVLIRGASSLARRLGVSPLVVGLTVVAFGTSAPELAVNIMAVTGGNTELSFGNIIGSNMANLGLIVAITAVFYPLDVRRVVIRREIPMMLLATVAVLVMASDAYLRPAIDGVSQVNMFDRSEALVLLLLFAIFIYYNIGDVVQQRADSRRDNSSTPKDSKLAAGVALDLFVAAIGLALLIGGGKFTVDGAVKIATRFNVPEAIIGLTLVAVGTSLPELVTSILAAIKKETDLAVGNIVGSNIFNLLFIMGSVGAVKDFSVPAGGHLDLLVTTILSAMLLVFTMTDNRRLVRGEGIALMVVYFGYMIWRMMGSSPAV